MDDTRRARLAHQIQIELSGLLMKGEIKDHRVDSLVSFSYVKLAKDGSTARVGVSGFKTRAGIDRAVEGLTSAAGYLQGRIGKAIRLRSTPRLHFVADHSIEEGQEVLRTLDEALRDGDEKRRTPPEQTDGA